MEFISCRLRRSLQLRDPEDEGHSGLYKISVTDEQSIRYVSEVDTVRLRTFESSKQGCENINYRNLLLSK